MFRRKRKKEIVELEVLSITIDNIGVLRSYYPVSGWAKWFEDELGQLWCRFSIAGPEGQTLQKIVIPARWVMEVRYRTQDAVRPSYSAAEIAKLEITG